MQNKSSNHQQRWRSNPAHQQTIDLSGYASAQQRRYWRQLNQEVKPKEGKD